MTASRMELTITAIAEENGEPAITWNRELWEHVHAGRFDWINGYIRHYYPEHPNADKDGRIYQHQVIASIVRGAPLEPDEEVHHRDEIRHHNWPHNLLVCHDTREHQRQHRMSNRRLKANREKEQTR